MGKVILCAGKQAETPYYFETTGISVYTMEELCHYIKHNTENLGEEMLSPSLAAFIRKELGLEACASKLERLEENRAGVKDVVLTILNATAYYTEEEIAGIINEFDMLNSLSAEQRRKRYADKCLKENKNSEAMHMYRKLIYGTDVSELDDTEYGNILHNMGVIHARAGAFSTAAEDFHAAYEKNGNKESLKQYLYALKLGHRDDEFDRGISAFTDDKALIDQIENELYYVSDTEENTLDYHELKKVMDLKEKGRIAEYYKAADEIVSHLKNKYRTENG